MPVSPEGHGECDHIVIRLPSGDLYDGGIGIHSDETYASEFVVDDMLQYDHDMLEKWAYGLDRTYPRFCPNFDKKVVSKLINTYLDRLSAICYEKITMARDKEI